jgi:hypothetical protein
MSVDFLCRLYRPLTNPQCALTSAARQAEIDQGNARLLNNLTSIASGGASMDTGMGKEKPLSRGEAPRSAGPSMQATQQKQEQERIALENQRMLQRIPQVRKRAVSPHCVPVS